MMRGLAAPELTASAYAAAERRRIALIVGSTFLVGLGAATLIALIQFASVAVLLTWILLIAMAWWPVVGLFSAFGLIVLFEQGNFDPLMEPGNFLLDTANRSGLTGVLLTPIDVLLLLTLAIWLARAITRRQIELRGGSLGWPMLAFLAALIFGLARGALGGGDWYVATWEGRYLFQIVVCYLLAANIVRTRWHVQLLITIALLATSLYAIEGAYRRVAFLDTGVVDLPMESAYEHDSVIYLGTLLLLIVAQQIFGAPRWQRVVGPVLFAIAGFTLLSMERRAGYICVMVAFLELAVLLFFLHRKAFALFVVPILIGAAIYFPMFWNASGPLAQPARAIRSLQDPNPRDAASNFARDLERTNILATMRSNPLVGVGFGRPYVFEVSVPDISWWPFWQYETHNAVHWIRMKTGPLGFIAFMVLMCSALALAAHHVRMSRDRDIRVFAVLALCGITMTLVFAYVDLGLTSGRVSVFLGTILGTLSVLDRLPSEIPSEIRLSRTGPPSRAGRNLELPA